MYRRLRILLIGGYALIAALLAGAGGWFTLAEREPELGEARQSAASLARALDEHVSRSIGEADLLLHDLAGWIDEHGGLARIAPATLHVRFKQQAERSPAVRAIFLYGADLKEIANSGEPIAPRRDGSEREYVAVHRDRELHDVFVGRTAPSPVLAGRPLIPVTLRLEGRDGSFAGVIGAAVNPLYFDAFYQSLGLASDAELILLRTDGSVLYRFPSDRFKFEETLAGTALFSEGLARRNAGTIEMRFPDENVLRIVSYRGRDDLPLAFAVSREKDAVLAAWRAGIETRAVLFLSALAVGGVLVWALLTKARSQTAADAALRASEARFSKFFQTVPLAATITRFDDGRFLAVNDAWVRTFGHARSSVVGMRSTDLGVFESDKREELLRSLETDHGLVDIDTRMRRRSGELVDVRVHAVAIDLEGERCVLALLENVTERKRSEERFAKFFRSSPAAHVISRLADGRLVEVNAAWSRTFGYAREEVIGRTSLELGVWADPPRRDEFVRTLRQAGRVERYPVKGRNKDGEPLELLLSGEVIDLDGQPHLLMSIADVTAETRAREALVRNEERFTRFFRESPAAHVISNAEDGRFREVNAAWTRMLGYTSEEALGRTGLELGIWIDPTRRTALRTATLEHGRADRFRTKLRRKDGTVFDAQISAELIELGGERFLLSSVHDMTAETAMRESLEEHVRTRTAELQAANEELEAFSYSVSHDMRAPIRAIAGFAEILRAEHGTQLEGAGRHLLERIARAADHMGELIDALLALARLMRQPLAPRRIDVSALARRVLDDLAERSPERKVETVIEPDLTAQADPVLMRSLLENLLGNAWKYTARAPGARIEFGRRDGAFYVRDNGTGFDMRYVERLFKPFERLHKQTDFPGTGIGLATVERILRRHGGRVWAESAPGAGATFLFTLSE